MNPQRLKCGNTTGGVDQGITTNTNKFYNMYYSMTFNHLLHVGWASGSLLSAIHQLKVNRYTKKNHLCFTAIACYRHMVDLARVIIFPLFYVLR
ncbi:MAG: hypothetical protein GY787_16845 [Alteromonadales bacterium]|nr:hypothetical protein [Alteromonadales bacterium]